MKPWIRPREWNFDIDRYINPYLPPSRLHRLPTPLSRFLGYRRKETQDVGNVLQAWWGFVGAFCGLAAVAAVFNNSGDIQARHPPAMIASFVRASAILEYNAIKSPLGQPRNALLGHPFSALVGVAITKLFLFHPDFERIRWLAGAVNCGVASAVMLLTGTMHPPGGASAVLAATEPAITDMGWYFVGLVMLGTMLLVVVGLVTNNIQRRFPVYWWTPGDVGKKQAEGEAVGESEKEGVDRDAKERESEERRFTEDVGKGQVMGKRNGIYISENGISLPVDLSLNREEVEMIERLRERLRQLKYQVFNCALTSQGVRSQGHGPTLFS
ncbi:HPP family-domain-containing protein [Clohesyomyces aquaticus]|uniref:HPP family-domain-containing protein n=1 Tax=Clohesyomyces aquaticus TaxID=1231657 RepID=A0A1Y2A4Y3_9PLEO|nr:HPP family-domain-containing protein [Clohesyomyces aquaticus]